MSVRSLSFLSLPRVRGERIPVASGVFDVVLRDIVKPLHFLVRQASNDFAGYAKHERPVGNRLAFRNQRACADQAIAADDRVIQHDCFDADEAAIADCAPCNTTP